MAELTGDSALYVGWVRHRRHQPRRHAFRLRTYHVLVDVDELPQLDRAVKGFGHNRPALTTFYDSDHFGASRRPVRDKIAAWLDDQGRALPGGRLQVLTNLRVAGYVFNPVSWWFCHEPDGQLRLILAEVNNTFGDHHVYVLDVDDPAGPAPANQRVVRSTAAKVFHVSPFLPIDGLQYRFSIRPPAGVANETVTVHMEVADSSSQLLDATQSGTRRPLTTATLWRTMLRFPLMPLWTITMIHWHAVRLAAKRTPFFRRPDPPDDGFDHGSSRRHTRQPNAPRKTP